MENTDGLFVQVFPSWCYVWYEGPSVILEEDAEDDLVGRLENCEVAGIPVGDTITDDDLRMAFIPSRRLIAFGYVSLLPDINDQARRACEIAGIPSNDFMAKTYSDPKAMMYLSQFWKERKTAMQGVAFLYADRHAKAGSAPHLKLLNEMTGLQKAEKKEGDKHLHLHGPGSIPMPTEDNQYETNGQGQLESHNAIDAEFEEVPR